MYSPQRCKAIIAGVGNSNAGSCVTIVESFTSYVYIHHGYLYETKNINNIENTQGHSECDDVCDVRSLDCDARNVLCDVSVFDCCVTEENVIWSKHLE